MSCLRTLVLAALCAVLVPAASQANPNVYVSRFWHNHQPLYWPEWNSNGSQTSRGQFAWDSIVLKPSQNYGYLNLNPVTGQHPENNLSDIFGLQDRVTSYQSGPRNSLTGFNSAGGFAISYSGSLIDNVRQLGSVNQLGYGGGWNSGYREARGWKTPAGSTRMDLVGFTYHHSLAPLLPKSVFRKEVQIFKQAWWKAWGGNSDLSDHSKGFFPTEMGYSRHLIDVLTEEGYQWVIVASHHISRTCPTYNTKANPEGSYNIFSSPPNKADQLGPSPTNGWWYSEPNPGNAAWNVAPFAYQLQKVKYVNPETGAEKTMIAVPSDDVLSYRFGYANEGIGQIGASISPFATDASRPVIVMPSTDGDNAWGGGSSSWFEATPQFFNGSASAGYKPTTPQDFVSAFGGNAPMTHVEDGAWIFPEMDYGSPNFMKWIEPPVATVANRGFTTVPGTQIDMETPGFALKFYSYAPLMAGANWVETAEQILRAEGGSVEAWKIQDPYNNLGNGQWTGANEVEQAWHIYLKGLDSGFNYYGGLGNDDEMKPGLATRRAVEKLTPWMTTARRNNDRTGPTVLKPQRFPYNPGGFTFGWFNQQPQIPNNAFLKRMNSEFYIWTHAYDLNGISADNVKLKIRVDADGTNPLNSNQNETYAGGAEVGQWVTITMNKREMPKTREALNAAAANSQIDYFLPVQADAVADYYFAKITDVSLPGFRSKLLDYYIEATDSKGNTSKSEIQHVWVDDYSAQTNGGGGGGGGGASSAVTLSPTNPVAGQPVTVTYNPAGRSLASANAVNIHHGYNQNTEANWTPLPGLAMTKSGSNWVSIYNVALNATTIALCFNNGSGTWDNNGGGNWNFNVTNSPPTNPPPAPTHLSVLNVTTNSVSLRWSNAATANSYIVYRGGVSNASTPDLNFVDTNCLPNTEYTYAVAAVNSVGASSLSTNVQARTLFLPVEPTNIRVTAPSLAVSNTNTSYFFSGHAGFGLTNGLTWSNSANGSTGFIPFSGATSASGWAWLINIVLTGGTNMLSFSGIYPTNLPPVQTGTDAPANYDGWDSGYTGGAGFGPWVMSIAGSGGTFFADASIVATNGSDSAQNYGSSWISGAGSGTVFGAWSFSSAGNGAFLFGNPANVGISGMGPKAFQLRGSGTTGNNFATANRPLAQPLQVGQSLSFLWGINWDCDATNGNKGFALLTGANEIVTVNNSTNADIAVNGVKTGFGYGTTAMRWAFKLLTANSLQITANDRDGSGTFTTNITVSGAPSSLRFYAANMENNANREPYFDDFRIEGSLYNNMHVGAPKGFGLWAFNGGSIVARRNLPATLETGDVLTIRMDNNIIDNGGKVGFALATSAGTNRFSFYFTGGGSSYQIDDAVTGRPSQTAYTDSGLLLTFKMTGSNTYTLNTGGAVVAGTLPPGEPITQLAVFNNNAGSGTERNFYVGEMTFTEQPITNMVTTVLAPSVFVQSGDMTDGIPDAWWIQYFGTTSGASASEDSDGDGFTNAQEYVLGTHPKDAASTFRITSIERNGTNTAVYWSSVEGKSYQLQGKTSLAILNWTNLAVPPVTALSNSASAGHPGSAAEHFYRVILAQ